MIYGLYLSAAGMQSNAYEMDVIANNLANAETVGFKHELALLAERQVETDESGRLSRRHPVLDQISGGTTVRPTFTTFAQGSLEQTGRPLDLAIRGPGFLQVLDGEEIRYTRNGQLSVDVQGRLTTAGGKSVLDTNGRPIFVDAQSAAPLSITEDGAVRQGQDQVARLGVVTFDDPQRLTKAGGGLYIARQQAPGAAESKVVPGYLEQSTVDPVASLTQMIQAQRAYQMNATMISLQDGMLSRAVNDLGKVV